MSVSSTTRQHYCGMSLYAKTMYVSINNAYSEIVLHRNIKSESHSLAAAVEPNRKDLDIGVQRLFVAALIPVSHLFLRLSAVILARRQVRPGKYSLRPRSCTLGECDPWR